MTASKKTTKKRSSVAAAPGAVPPTPAQPSPLDGLTANDLITDPAALAALAPDLAMKQLLLRAAIDKAATEHEQAEETATAAALEAGAPAGTRVLLNRPNLIVGKNERAAATLLAELDRTLANAGATAFAAGPRATPERMRQVIPASEVEAVRKGLSEIPAKRDAAQAAARDAAKLPQHVPGSAKWRCLNETCEHYRDPFNSQTIEYIRRKAKSEPGWKFACPACGSSSVILVDEAA